MQRRRTSERVPGAFGSVIRYSIEAPISTGSLGHEQHSAGAHIPGLTLGFVFGAVPNYLEGEAQVEALILSLNALQ